MEDEDQTDVLMFDSSCVGTSLAINNNGLRAVRNEESFCNGVVFSKVNSVFSNMKSFFSKVKSVFSKVKTVFSGEEGLL